MALTLQPQVGQAEPLDQAWVRQWWYGEHGRGDTLLKPPHEFAQDRVAFISFIASLINPSIPLLLELNIGLVLDVVVWNIEERKPSIPDRKLIIHEGL